MAEKIDYTRNDEYRKDYFEALEPWEHGRHEDYVEVANFFTAKGCLPYLMQYCYMLIASAEHHWAAAEEHCNHSERIYQQALSLTKPREVEEKRVLARLRVELDEIRKAHGEDPFLYRGPARDVTTVDYWEENVSSAEIRSELVTNAAQGGEVKNELADDEATAVHSCEVLESFRKLGKIGMSEVEYLSIRPRWRIEIESQAIGLIGR